MIGIFIYTSSGRESLDTGSDSELNLEHLSPFFDEELKNGEFSYPARVPWTERNQRLLGNPEMIESSNQLLYYTADIYWNGIPELQDAKLTILEFEGELDYRRGAYIFTISGSDSFLGMQLKGKTLKDLRLCGLIDMGMPSRDFANYIMKLAVNPYPFAFAPVRCEEFIDSNRADFSTEYLESDTINKIITDSSLTNGWSFGVLGPSPAGAPVTSGSIGYNHHRSIPFFRLQYVFVCAIEEFGYRVTGDFINDERYKDIYIWNNRALEIPSAINTDINRIIYPPNHMPPIKIVTFLAATAKLFGFGIFKVDGKTLHIKYKKTALAGNDIIDISAAVENKFKALNTDIANEGFSVKWDTDSPDRLISDRIQDLGDRDVRAIVNFKANLTGMSFNPALKTETWLMCEVITIIMNTTHPPVAGIIFPKDSIP